MLNFPEYNTNKTPSHTSIFFLMMQLLASCIADSRDKVVINKKIFKKLFFWWKIYWYM